jgi:hypothetical protein
VSAVMTEVQPAPRLRWYRGDSRATPVTDELLTAADFAAFLEADPGRIHPCIAEVKHPQSVWAWRPQLGKWVKYQGEHPSLAVGAAAEPTARRELVRMRDEFARDHERAKARVVATPQHVHANRREAAVLGEVVARIDAALAALAPSRSETAVEANR